MNQKYKNIKKEKKKEKPVMGMKFKSMSELINAHGKYPPGTILVYEKSTNEAS